MTHPPNSGAFAQTLDVRLRDGPTAEAYEVELAADARHLNANGIVHGGVLMALLDMALAGAATCALEPGERIASININTDFLRAAKPGRLVARGSLVRRGRTVAFPEGTVVDGDGTLVARATGIWAITRA